MNFVYADNRAVEIGFLTSCWPQTFIKRTSSPIRYSDFHLSSSKNSTNITGHSSAYIISFHFSIHSIYGYQLSLLHLHISLVAGEIREFCLDKAASDGFLLDVTLALELVRLLGRLFMDDGLAPGGGVGSNGDKFGELDFRLIVSSKV